MTVRTGRQLPLRRREGEADISDKGNWRRGRLIVREAHLGDLDAIARLERASFAADQVSRRSLRDFLRAAHRPVIAATLDDDLAGYALVSLRKNGRKVRIYSIAVDQRFARRGVGRALVQACERYARRHGRAALRLEVRYDNAGAIALYESLGFRQFGEHARYYADGATALRYEKSLVSAARANSDAKDEAPWRRISRGHKLCGPVGSRGNRRNRRR